MRASVGQAAWLAGSAVGEEIGVANRSSNASASNQECRPVGVDALDILCVSSVDSSFWIADREKWASWIESNDRVNAATTNVLASVAGNVSAQAEPNDLRAAPVEHVVLVQEVEVGSDELTDSWHAVGCANVVDRT